MEEEHRYWVLVSRDPADEIHVGWSWRRSRGRTSRVHNKTQQLGINQTRLERRQEAALQRSGRLRLVADVVRPCPALHKTKSFIWSAEKKTTKKNKNNSSTCWEHSRLRLFSRPSSRSALRHKCWKHTTLSSHKECQCVSVCVCVGVSAGSPLWTRTSRKAFNSSCLWLPVPVQLTTSDLWTTSTRKKFWFINFTKEPRGPCQFFKS